MTMMKMVTENLRFQKVVNEKLVFFTGVPAADGVVVSTTKEELGYNTTDRAPTVCIVMESMAVMWIVTSAQEWSLTQFRL